MLEMAFLIVTAAIFITIVGVALFVVPLTSSSSESFGIFNFIRTVLFVGGLLLGLVGVGLAVRAFTYKMENDLALRVGQVLAVHLDDRYTFIRNISKRRLGYIDAALIGPAGVLVFRVVDFEGTFINEAGKWLKERRPGELVPTMTNPTQDVVDDIKNLRDYLAEHDLREVPIFGVVVLTNDDPVARLTLKDPVLPATHLSSLHTRLQRNYLAKQDRMGTPMIRAIVKLLYGENIA
ncbi:MAG: hypothetical protein OHK0046_30690 [Anaerolineae bacterium]